MHLSGCHLGIIIFKCYENWPLFFKKIVLGKVSWPLGPTRKLFLAEGRVEVGLL
jgi:hypothetical protein